MHFITSTALLYYRLLYVFITSVCFIKTVGKARNRSHHLRLGNSDYSSHRKWKMTSVSFIRQLYCRNQHPSMSVTIATNYIRGEGGTQHENSFLQINRQCLPNAVHRSSRAAAAPTRREQRTDELLWTSTTQQTHQLTFFNRLLPNDLNPISTKNNSYISDKSEIIGHSSCSFPFPATHHTHATTKNKKKNQTPFGITRNMTPLKTSAAVAKLTFFSLRSNSLAWSLSTEDLTRIKLLSCTISLSLSQHHAAQGNTINSANK